MIYTVTFNPALDYVMRVENFESGKTNRSVSEEVFYGGKGINVSVVLRELGVRSTALGFIAGFTGDELERMLNSAGIHTSFIKLPRGMTRINVKLKTDKETEINAQGPKIDGFAIEKLMFRLLKLRKDDILVLAGSVPKSISNDIYKKICEKVEKIGVRVVVDAEKDLIMKVLPHKPFLIKPNKSELEEIIGKKLETDDEIADAVNQLHSLGARNVLASLGSRGAVLLDETGELTFINAVEGELVNSVGAGDSMVAGFLAGYLGSGDYQYALKLGTVAGGATACSAGLATKAKINGFIKGM